ncbi:hypothetical protein DFH29DRAFT_881409 [Suillus ampliporus]|nr:hypothetical protein DFH29DRAFT_881409 [Suillus ampliporus]
MLTAPLREKAHAQNGETVLDLGSGSGAGAGIDVLLAVQKVGPKGQAIGLDISSVMVNLARKNAFKHGYKQPQVVFIQTKLTQPYLLELPQWTAFCQTASLICSPARSSQRSHLRISSGPSLPLASGAVQLEQYRAFVKDAGFTDALFVETGGGLEVYNTSGPTGGCTPSSSSAKCCAAATSPLPSGTSTNGLVGRESHVQGDDRAGSRRYWLQGGHRADAFSGELDKFYDEYGKTKQVIFYYGSFKGRGTRCGITSLRERSTQDDLIAGFLGGAIPPPEHPFQGNAINFEESGSDAMTTLEKAASAPDDGRNTFLIEERELPDMEPNQIFITRFTSRRCTGYGKWRRASKTLIWWIFRAKCQAEEDWSKNPMSPPMYIEAIRNEAANLSRRSRSSIANGPVALYAGKLNILDTVGKVGPN